MLRRMIMAGGGSPPAYTYATWNPSDKAADITLTGSNLTMYNGSASEGHDLVRATIGKSSGKWYFEVSSPTDRALAPADGFLAGLSPSTQALSGNYPGQVSGSVGFSYRRKGGSNGVVYYLDGGGAVFPGFDPAVSSGWVGFAFDGSYGIWVNIDGTWMGSKSPKTHPSSPYIALTGTLYPAASCYYRRDTYGSELEQTINAGASSFNIGSAFGTGGDLEGFNQGWFTT